MPTTLNHWLHSRRIRYLAGVALFHFLLLLLFRSLFLLYFSISEAELKAGVLFESFYYGVKFDLRLVMLLELPLLLLALLPRFNLVTSAAVRLLARFYLLVVMAVVLFTYFVDFGHYAYLKERLNASVLRFLEDFDISMSMVWESYPVIWLSLLLALLLLLYFWGISKLETRTLLKPAVRPMGWKPRLIGGVMVALITVGGIYGKLSWYPLRWSDALAHNNAFASALALNPLLFYFDTLKNNVKAYDENEARNYYPLMARYLGLPSERLPAKGEQLDYSRQVAPRIQRARPPNIIYVLVESFGANQMGLFGNTLDATPNLDRIASKGLLFDRFYVPAGGTARSVYAAMTGIADVYPVRTASRNPLIIDQQMMINQFKGYDKYYFLGGSASWGNIRGVLQHNIPGLQLYEEGSYSSPVNDVWGISDLDLFREASQVFQKRSGDKPFIAFIQTSGNHPPFTIPTDNLGYKVKSLPEKKSEWQGFPEQGRYNSVRLVDHFIAELIRLGEAAGYGEETIYVFHGDHGITSSPSPHMGPAYDALNFFTYHTPLILYSPKYLPKPERISRVMSEVDVFPTLAGLAGLGYRNTTLGRDIFNRSAEMDEVVYLNYFNKQFGAMNSRFVAQTDLSGKQVQLFDLASSTPGKDVKAEFPQQAEMLSEYARGIYQTARYMLHFNGHQEK